MIARVGLHSVMVALDLRPGSERVVARTALLPLVPGARVTFVHALTARHHQEVEEARRSLVRLTASAVLSFSDSVRVEYVVTPSPLVSVALAAETDLVVMGRPPHRRLRHLLGGSSVQRMLHESGRPVLVVGSHEPAPYHRPLAAIDLTRTGGSVVSALLRLLGTAHPEVRIVHAYDVPYPGLFYSGHSIEEAAATRERTKEIARTELRRLLVEGVVDADLPHAERPHWELDVQFGSARSVVRRAATKHQADLVALGTHGYSRLGRAFLGTVAGDLMRELAADVLMVPERMGAERQRDVERQSVEPRLGAESPGARAT